MKTIIKRVYIYSDGWWYSMSKAAFIKLAKRGKYHGFNDGIDLEGYGAKHINKPSSMCQYGEGEDYYTNNPYHHVVNGVIDLNRVDWELHLSMVDAPKHTPGKWRYSPSTPNNSITISGNEMILGNLVNYVGIEETEANAQLIVEAANVAFETGKTPRQLADRVKELTELAADLLVEKGLRPEAEELRNEIKNN